MTSPCFAADFLPDSSLVHHLHPSPNINGRRNGLVPEILILHYTGLESVERSIAVLADPICQVSCHYVIDEGGRITQMVPEAMRAWHAGVSHWKGQTDLNSWSIGIEIQNPGHEQGYPDFPEAQMLSVMALSKDIVTRHKIRAQHVLGHSDIAPLRKIDPGEKFDWPRLARNGVGHWISPAKLDSTDEGLSNGSQELEVAEFQSLLKEYGYGCPQSGKLDDETEKYIAAFQRHFRPARVDGRLDRSTALTLKDLLSDLHK